MRRVLRTLQCYPFHSALIQLVEQQSLHGAVTLDEVKQCALRYESNGMFYRKAKAPLTVAGLTTGQDDEAGWKPRCKWGANCHRLQKGACQYHHSEADKKAAQKLKKKRQAGSDGQESKGLKKQKRGRYSKQDQRVANEMVNLVLQATQLPAQSGEIGRAHV